MEETGLMSWNSNLESRFFSNCSRAE